MYVYIHKYKQIHATCMHRPEQLPASATPPPRAHTHAPKGQSLHKSADGQVSLRDSFVKSCFSGFLEYKEWHQMVSSLEYQVFFGKRALCK